MVEKRGLSRLILFAEICLRIFCEKGIAVPPVFLSRIYSDLFKKTALAGVFLFGDAAVEAFSDGG